MVYGGIQMQSVTFYIALMLLAGLGIPTMAALNASLGAKLQSPFLAVIILLLFAFILVLSLLLVVEGVPRNIQWQSIPWYLYISGIFFAFYILTASWVMPRFGAANAIGFVLLGQLIAMVVIDHYGLFGLARYEINIKRLCGLILMIAGVFLVLGKSVD